MAVFSKPVRHRCLIDSRSQWGRSVTANSILSPSLGTSAMQTKMSQSVHGLARCSTLTHGKQHSRSGNKHDPDTIGLGRASTGS